MARKCHYDLVSFNGELCHVGSVKRYIYVMYSFKSVDTEPDPSSLGTCTATFLSPQSAPKFSPHYFTGAQVLSPLPTNNLVYRASYLAFRFVGPPANLEELGNLILHLNYEVLTPVAPRGIESTECNRRHNDASIQWLTAFNSQRTSQVPRCHISPVLMHLMYSW